MWRTRRRTASALVASVAALGLSMGLVAPASASIDEDTTLDPDDVFDPSVVSPISVTRLSGPDRIATSVAASRSRDWGCAVIVARQDEYPDALASGPLADVLNAPILLIPSAAQSEEVPEIVTTEIKRLYNNIDPKQCFHAYGKGDDRITTPDEAVELSRGQLASLFTIHVIGGTGVISEDQADQLAAAVNPGITLLKRWRGVDRYQTAVEVAEETIYHYAAFRYIEPWSGDVRINTFLTTGMNFPDALAGGTGAAQNDGIILLTKGEEVERFTDEFVTNLDQTIVDLVATLCGDLDLDPLELSLCLGLELGQNTPEIITVGGPADRAARDDAGYSVDQSYVGADRYETAALLANADWWGTPTSADDFDTVGVASGQTYADAVVAGGYMANADGPLLLTRSNALPDVTRAYLEANSFTLDYAFVFGGSATIDSSVVSEIRSALNWN